MEYHSERTGWGRTSEGERWSRMRLFKMFNVSERKREIDRKTEKDTQRNVCLRQTGGRGRRETGGIVG